MKENMRNEGPANGEAMADDSMEWAYGEESVLNPIPIETKEHIAKILATSPEALEAFEASYQKDILEPGFETLDIFDVSGKEIRDARKDDQTGTVDDLPEGLVERIVAELMEQSSYIDWDGEKISYGKPHMRGTGVSTGETGIVPKAVTKEDLLAAPPMVRPQLAGNFMRMDISGPSYPPLLEFYTRAMNKAEGEADRDFCWNLFRQGLDILDLDPVLYAILGTNKNAIGHWLPPLAEAASKHGFFVIPKTRVIKVPMQMLQLSRLDGVDTPGTLAVVDRFCFDAFELDENQDYFVKTGTYSSKFDFRNAHVHGPKEVRELGEYLLYIQSEAARMAGPTSSPCVYGVSTTNEWAVREYIPDPENSPTIYKGLPLRTEYRVFIDCDTDEVMGMSPYWEPNMMKKRFGHEADAASPHQFHDYVTFCAAEPKLMERYEANKDAVRRQVEAMLPDLDLKGQWSLDIMQSGDTFYCIDMALAATSALRDCVPAGKLKPAMDISLPKIPEPKAGRVQIGQAEG